MRHALRAAAARLLRYALTCVAFLTLVFWAFVADASPLIPHGTPGISCNRLLQCVAHNSPGGYQADYLDLARRIEAAGGSLAIKGDCDSMCAVIADRLRHRACAENGARLRFHQLMSTYPNGHREFRSGGYSAQFEAAIDAYGGEPVDPTRTSPLPIPARALLPACR